MKKNVYNDLRQLQSLFSSLGRGKTKVRLVIGNGVSSDFLIPRGDFRRVWAWAKQASTGLPEDKVKILLADYTRTREDYERFFVEGVMRCRPWLLDELQHSISESEAARQCWDYYEAHRIRPFAFRRWQYDWLYKSFVYRLYDHGSLDLVVTTNFDTFLNRLFEGREGVVFNPCDRDISDATCYPSDERRFRNPRQDNQRMAVFKTHGCLSYAAELRLGTDCCEPCSPIRSIGLGGDDEDIPVELKADGWRHFIDYNHFSREQSFGREIAGANEALLAVPPDGSQVIIIVAGFGAYHREHDERSEEMVEPIMRLVDEGKKQFHVVLIDPLPDGDNALWNHLCDPAIGKSKSSIVLPFTGKCDNVLREAFGDLNIGSVWREEI